MADVTLFKPATVQVKFLKVEAGVRYWEDAIVNGTAENDDNPTIPCRINTVWCPIIDLDTGKIEGWPEGTTADVHYKVCDDGRYSLLDADRKVICCFNGYVPDILAPGGKGYGDYIIMDIGPDGQISDWKVTLEEFERASAKGGAA